MSKFKVGDRVRVVSCGHAGDAFPAGTVGVITETNNDAHLHGTVVRSGGRNDNFRTDELELVTQGESEVSNQRRTFKQLVETPTVKKGALWQEACNDGTQEYELLDVKTFSKDDRADNRIFNRSLVEDNKKMFVEVFAVTPPYMTREELDQWEAFRASRKPARKTSATKTTEKKHGYTRTPAQRAAASKRAKAQWKARKAAA